MNLRDIKDTVPLSGADPVLWPWLLGIAVLAGIIGAIIYYLITHKKPPPLPRPLTEPEKAQQTMLKALSSEDPEESRARMVCPALRRMLNEEKFCRSVMQLYTSLPEDRLPDLFSNAEKNTLRKICEIANYTPNSLAEPDARLILDAVERFLSYNEQTKEATQA